MREKPKDRKWYFINLRKRQLALASTIPSPLMRMKKPEGWIQIPRSVYRILERLGFTAFRDDQKIWQLGFRAQPPKPAT